MTVLLPPLQRTVGAYYFDHQDPFLLPTYRYLGYAWPLVSCMMNGAQVSLSRYPGKYDVMGDVTSSHQALAAANIMSVFFIGAHAMYHLTISVEDMFRQEVSECHLANKLLFVLVSTVESLLWDLTATLAAPSTVAYITHTVLDSYLRFLWPAMKVSDSKVKYLPRLLGACSVFYLSVFTDMSATFLNLGLNKSYILHTCMGPARLRYV